MSTTTRTLTCTAEEVFSVLDNGWLYASWVVGASRIRDVDPGWPAVGSRIHHSVGSWPALISDSTEVLEIDRPRELKLRVRAWPTGEGEVRVIVRPLDAGCEVEMQEQAVSGPARLIPRAVQDAMLHARNVEALRRLAYLAEGGAAS
jgi:hypothetical protein